MDKDIHIKTGFVMEEMCGKCKKDGWWMMGWRMGGL